MRRVIFAVLPFLYSYPVSFRIYFVNFFSMTTTMTVAVVAAASTTTSHVIARIKIKNHHRRRYASHYG